MARVYHLAILLLVAVIHGGLSDSVPNGEAGARPGGGGGGGMTLNQTEDAAKTAPNLIGVLGKRSHTTMFALKPEMFQTFYVFLGISFLLIFFILFRMYRLRSHRAERRYGVQGDKSAQELTHLPTAIEEDESELEDDETLFDINKTRVYVA